MRKILVSCVALIAAVGARAATDYTWTGAAEGDGQNWYNPTNWGKTAVGDYPKNTNYNVIFPASTEVTAVITNDITVYKVQFNAGCSVTLRAGANGKVCPTLKANNQFTDNGIVNLTLDGAGFYRAADWTPKANAVITLADGAYFYVNSFYMTSMSSLSLSGRSTASVGGLQINSDKVLTIDDSTFTSRGNTLLGTANPGGGRVVFKGANPVFKNNSGTFYAYNNASMTAGGNLDFEVPAGGFAEAPLQVYGAKFCNGQNNIPSGYFHFNVLATSPALSAAGTTDCALMLTPQGINKISQITGPSGENVEARFTDGTPDVTTADSASARALFVSIGSGNKLTPVAEHGSIIEYKTTAVARHAITATAWVAGIATQGSTSELELWVGESNSEGALEFSSKVVPTGAGRYDLTFTAPENVGEKTYYFQLRLRDKDGDTETALVKTSIFSNTTKDTTTYTWKAKDNDWTGDWNDPDHWDSDFATADGYPHTANATAKFPRGHEIAVTVNDNYTVGTLDFKDYNIDDMKDVIDVTFRGKEGDDYGTNKVLKATTLSINAKGGSVTLDRAALKVGDFTLGFRRLLEIRNGSWFYAGGVTSGSSGTIEIKGGSYASFGSMLQENPDTTLIIDDATLYMRGNLTHATANSTTSGGKVFFRGQNPRMRYAAGTAVNHRANGAYTMVYTFEVPVGGGMPRLRSARTTPRSTSRSITVRTSSSSRSIPKAPASRRSRPSIRRSSRGMERRSFCPRARTPLARLRTADTSATARPPRLRSDGRV